MIPRTITDVENEGWERTERPPGPLPELRMYCLPGRIVCPLYDTAGFVAGLMVAVSTRISTNRFSSYFSTKLKLLVYPIATEYQYCYYTILGVLVS